MIRPGGSEPAGQAIPGRRLDDDRSRVAVEEILADDHGDLFNGQSGEAGRELRGRTRLRAYGGGACSAGCPKVSGMDSVVARENGQTMTKARPSTSSMGIVPPPASLRCIRES
ncbi:hypothetical protein SAMN05216276_1014166 [Streptosporangium subroseum]|uniref:Uncharacterized protein n=1 Tax=Streptosporangium subroseum TaxID=106412 RepID=A0A239GX46_9ACTN|nr:hypothetical protein SAMN05216276_1014166 [Streptosporangium subroseum]